MFFFKQLCCPIIIAAVTSLPCVAWQHLPEVALYTSDANSCPDDRIASLADFVARKLGSSTLKEVALYTTEPYEVSTGGFQGKVQGYAVWASIFEVLGIRPILGRAFLLEEKQPDQSMVAILSYELWQTAFKGDPAVLGKTVSVGGGERTLVGILPKSVVTGGGQILIPFVPGQFAGDAHDREFHVIAAVKPGVTLVQVQAELDLLDQKSHRDEPKYLPAWKGRVAPMKQL